MNALKKLKYEKKNFVSLSHGTVKNCLKQSCFVIRFHSIFTVEMGIFPHLFTSGFVPTNINLFICIFYHVGTYIHVKRKIIKL